MVPLLVSEGAAVVHSIWNANSRRIRSQPGDNLADIHGCLAKPSSSVLQYQFCIEISEMTSD